MILKRYFAIPAMILGIGIGNLTAQTKPVIEPKAYQDSSGLTYWNKNMPVYISISSAPDAQKFVLKSQKFPQYDQPYFFDTEGENLIRTRWAVNKKTRQAVQPQIEMLWEVITDSKPPVSSALFSSATKYSKSGKNFYGPDDALKVSAKDAISGVESLYYSANGANYELYTNPITFTVAGDYTIKYFAADRVGNSENDHSLSFTIDASAPSSLCLIAGVKLGAENIISASSRLHFEAQDDLSGVKRTFYAFDDGKMQLYNGKNIIVNNLDDGSYTMKFYSEDNVGNKESIQEYSFYLDKTAPIAASDVLGDRYVVNGQTYFSGKTKMKLTAVDNKAGVKEILYSVNGEKFQRYTDAFYLPNKAGMHVVRYFATDNVENVTENPETLSVNYMEYRHKVDRIYIDLLGPVISSSIDGPKYKVRDSLYIGPNTKITFSAKDSESGLHHISYILNGQGSELAYNEPITLASANSGSHRIDYFAYDNVNNRNIGSVNVILDKTPAEIQYKFSVVSTGKEADNEIYPSNSKLFLSAQDDLTGIKEIYYSLNGSPELIYKNYITGFRKGEVNTLKVRVRDMLDNQSEKEFKFFAN